MVLTLILILLIISGFASGISMSKIRLKRSLILFSSIVIGSFLLALITPISFINSIRWPLINKDFKEIIFSLHPHQSVIDFSPSLDDNVMNFVNDILRAFLFILYIAIFYAVVGLNKFIKDNKNRVKIKKKKEVRVNYLGGLVRSLQYVILFSIAILPLGYITRVFKLSVDLLEKVGISCNSVGSCDTLFFLEHDVLLNSVSEKEASNGYLNYFSDNKTSKLVDELENSAEALKLLFESDFMRMMFEPNFNPTKMNESTINFPQLKQAIIIGMNSEILSQTIVDFINSSLDDFANTIRIEYPTVDSRELHFTKKTLMLEIDGIFEAFELTLAKGLIKLVDGFNAGDINRVFTDIGVDGLRDLISTVESINVFKKLASHIDTQNNLINTLISKLISPYIVTAIYFFNILLGVLNETIVEFRQTPFYSELEIIYYKNF